MNDELLMRDLKQIENTLDTLTDDGMNYQKWFVSFGSLLYLIRDKKHGIEFNQDIDVSVVGPHNFEKIDVSLRENGFERVSIIENDQNNEVLFADYKSPNGLSLDLFFWIETPGYLWHTYDYMREGKRNPSFYHFKAVPKYMMEGEPYKYIWFDEISPLKIPKYYGTLLDYWYPHWFIPDSDFGTSKTLYKVEVKTCNNLINQLNKLVK